MSNFIDNSKQIFSKKTLDIKLAMLSVEELTQFCCRIPGLVTVEMIRHFADSVYSPRWPTEEESIYCQLATVFAGHVISEIPRTSFNIDTLSRQEIKEIIFNSFWKSEIRLFGSMDELYDYLRNVNALCLAVNVCSIVELEHLANIKFPTPVLLEEKGSYQVRKHNPDLNQFICINYSLN